MEASTFLSGDLRRHVTIRKTLMRAFLLIGLVPAVLLAILDFFHADQAMESAIEYDLAVQASAVASDINKIMFERLENAATWSTLDVMQDLQVQDVDKRLSNFLAKLKTGYGGVYRELYALDARHRIIGSSNPADLRRQLDSFDPWRQLTLAGAQLSLERPLRDGENISLVIRTPIRSQFGSHMLGDLQLVFNWAQIDQLLDAVGGSKRMVALIDEHGQLLAASRTLRDAGLLRGQPLADWHLSPRLTGAFKHAGPPVWPSDVVVGMGRAADFAGFAGFGLSTLIIQPNQDALAPVRHMAFISLAVLAGLALTTLVAAGWVSRAIARPIVALTEFTRQFKHGQTKISSLPAASGEVGELGEAFVKLMQDIEQSQRQLIQASKLAAVGEMASVMAHEVRTPLGILRSSAQILRREPAISDEGRELMIFIESETERLNGLVSAMLDSARPRPLRKALADLNTQARQCGSMLLAQMEKRGISITYQLDAVSPFIDCDVEQMTQVMLNLLLNAMQVLPENGQIQLVTRDDSEQLFIEISDNGPGIPPDARARIFEAFFFGREGGVGLGLAIVQQIVTAHGGEITVGEGELGGARFIVRLPRKAGIEANP
jgi:two-component system, NtrC family, sensor histidine kinase HydH